jgi:hypothetical protein
VYANDSHTLSLVVQFSYYVAGAVTDDDWNAFRSYTVEQRRGGNTQPLRFDITTSDDTAQCMEAELLMAGATVAGASVCRRPLVRGRVLSFEWNCYFPNSGIHEMAVLLRVGNDTSLLDVGSLRGQIRVVQFDHLTQRQARMVAVAAAIVGAALAFAEQATKLHLVDLVRNFVRAIVP